VIFLLIEDRVLKRRRVFDFEEQKRNKTGAMGRENCPGGESQMII
jgi:hypothetical protein